MVQFVDLDQERESLEEERLLRPGSILFDAEAGSWKAFRPSTGFNEAGMGAPTRLEPGLWLSNMDFDRTRALDRPKGVTMRHDGWLRMKMDRIVAAWLGENQPLEKAVPLVASFSDRIVRLVQEAFYPHMRRLNIADASEIRTQITKASSLAGGIANLNSPAIRAGDGGDKRITEHFNRTYQWGMFIKGSKVEEEGHVRLTFSFPRLSYALAITAGQVPTGQGWQLAFREDAVSTQDFINQILDTGRAPIFRASIRPSQPTIHEYVDAFISPLHAGEDGSRSRFIAAELQILADYYDIAVESAICGDGWGESSTGLLLRELEDVAGGAQAARASWSVALAADNILSSAFRKPRSGQPADFAEPIWLAARDRAVMFPVIQAFYDSGATLVSAMQGTISVKCPSDPELLITVLDTAWEKGLTLALDEVEMLAGMGLEVPTEESRFGGNDVDYLLASLVHARKKRSLYLLDSVQTQPRAAREKEYRKITG